MKKIIIVLLFLCIINFSYSLTFKESLSKFKGLEIAIELKDSSGPSINWRQIKGILKEVYDDFIELKFTEKANSYTYHIKIDCISDFYVLDNK